MASGFKRGKDGSLSYTYSNGNGWSRSADRSTMVIKSGPWEKTIVNGRVVKTSYTYANGKKNTW